MPKLPFQLTVSGSGLLIAACGRSFRLRLPGGGGVPHRTLINAAWKVLAALRVKSTGMLGSVGKNPTFTGAVVPGVNAGIKTVALIGAPTTVNDCKPVPALT